ncbi:MAG: phenylacetate--CoA ligase family protein [Nitrosomonadales bacterium]|nr:phenylacetate--CoA ligase family protein [Nitrosomonadales bacterium]
MTHLRDIKDSMAAMGRTAITDPVATRLFALLMQFEDSQWRSPQDMQQKQLAQFALLAAHAYRHSPFFRSRFDQAGLDHSRAWTADSFTSIPLLTRAELMQQADNIYCRAVPGPHGAVHKIQTSGSTGQVVTVAKTEFNQLLWLALAMREHLWHERDFSSTLAVIKALTPTLDDPVDAARLGWGHPATLLLRTGPSYAQPLAMDVAQQAAWLARIDPKYLLTYPSNLGALLDRYEHGDAVPPSLRQIRTVGETLHPGLRERCRELGSIEIVDMYSSQEVGLIALQCPVSGLYHIQSESLIVEVLDEDGRQCQPGEIGRVVITDLHNFATPIIRYEIRDYAEVGPTCSCGRGLPTLSRIMGRRRNMVVFPDGRRHWPLIGAHSYREVADILQYQAIQHSLEDIEIRLVVDEPLSKTQEARLTELAQQALGHPFPLRFTYSIEELPKTKGGKFEEFISLVK